jgi:hypothetical protein
MKGIVYYTDNRCDELIFSTVQKQISKSGLPIVSVSLKLIDFGENIVFDGERSRLTMFKQILLGLEKSVADIIFFCEHDVLYHPSHFLFIPDDKNTFYYNENRWRVDFKTGQALFYRCPSTSGLCAYKDLLLEYYRDRVKRVEKDGYDHKENYEPGLKSGHQTWLSEYPNIDIRHKDCLTESRWSQNKFKDKSTCLGWTLADEVPGWGQTKNRMNEFLKEKNSQEVIRK